MPSIHETRQLPYSAEQMYDLVADVARYAEFLPWVVATRVQSDSDMAMVADMLVGFHNLREKFTSRVTKQRPERITVHYVDGPLRDLENCWKFIPLTTQTCEIDFTIQFNFRNPLFEKLAGQYIDKAFRKMVNAFETRAAELYGNVGTGAASSSQITGEASV